MMSPDKQEWIEVPCEECQGSGSVFLGDWRDPSCPESRCETCEGSGTVDEGVEVEADEHLKVAA